MLHRVLRGKQIVFNPDCRTDLIQLSAGKDDPGCMGRNVPRQTLDPQGGFIQLLIPPVGIDHLVKPRILLNRRLQRHLYPKRHSFAKHVNLPQRNLQNPADIAQHLLGAQRTERRNMRDMLFAILFSDILNHFVAPVIRKVGINIRH